MDHVSPPEDYYTDDLWNDSPVTETEREVLRDEIRQLVLGIKEEGSVGEIQHPAIGDITLTSFRDEDSLSITAYLFPNAIETEPIGDEIIGKDSERTVTDEAHYLRDLGDEWEALEYDLISELVLMLDLPEMPSDLAPYLLAGTDHGPCLYCTMRSPSQATFSITAHIPETTQKLYDNAEFEVARRLNIPIDGASNNG